MNERIRELAEQAGLLKVADAPLMKKYMPKEIKFAELIVKECVDIANDTRYDGKVVANRIKFVFGVEE